MCQEMFFYHFGDSDNGMPTPEICFLPGQLKRAILPKVSLSVGEMDTQPSNCEADTVPLSYRRPSAIFFVNAYGCQMML